jgi:hypothetical protein
VMPADSSCGQGITRWITYKLSSGFRGGSICSGDSYIFDFCIV